MLVQTSIKKYIVERWKLKGYLLSYADADASVDQQRSKATSATKTSTASRLVSRQVAPASTPEAKPFECEHGCGFDGATEAVVEAHELTCSKNPTNKTGSAATAPTSARFAASIANGITNNVSKSACHACQGDGRRKHTCTDALASWPLEDDVNWKSATDKKTHKSYWWNTVTKAVSWNHPSSQRKLLCGACRDAAAGNNRGQKHTCGSNRGKSGAHTSTPSVPTIVFDDARLLEAARIAAAAMHAISAGGGGVAVDGAPSGLTARGLGTFAGTGEFECSFAKGEIVR
jgi:hypothetical protein